MDGRVPFICGGVSCLVGGVLSDALARRLSNKWLARAIFPLCGYTCAAAAMFFVPWARTPEQATLLMCIASAGNDFGQGATGRPLSTSAAGTLARRRASST